MHYSGPRLCIPCMAGLRFPALVVKMCFSGPSGPSSLWEGSVVSNQYRCAILIWDARFRQDNQPVTMHPLIHAARLNRRIQMRSESDEAHHYLVCSPRTLIETWALECVFYKKYSGCCGMAKVLCIFCAGSVLHIHQTLYTSTSVRLLRAGYCLFCAQICPCCLILLLPIQVQGSVFPPHNRTLEVGEFRVGGGVHDSYTFQCGLVGSFTSPGIDTR